MTDVLLAEVTRGGAVESRHFGRAVIASASGVVWSSGDVERPIFPRSAIKPIQALQLIESGAADAFGLGTRQLALSCASHSGQSFHTDLVRQWLAQVGLSETALGCGAHWPLSQEAEHELVRSDLQPGRVHNNCSGKHAGFLNAARWLGEPVDGYLERGHPVQARWLAALEDLSEETLDPGLAGIDGCSIPSQPISLVGLCRAFARLASRTRLAPARRAAIQRLETAMAAHPELVAGTGRMCTRLISSTNGRVLAKTGAEGVYIAWIPELGAAVALKIADGATRAAEVAVAALIRRALGADHVLAGDLASLQRQTLYASDGAVVGEVRAV